VAFALGLASGSDGPRTSLNVFYVLGIDYYFMFSRIE